MLGRFILLSTLLSVLILAGCSDDPVEVPKAPVVTEHEVLSSQFIRNRFFRLTSDEEASRVPMGAIDFQSIRIYRKIESDGDLQPGEVENIAAFADMTGDWINNDFTQTPAVYGARWREVELNLDATDPSTSLMADENAILRGVDLGSDLGDVTELAVSFRYWTGPDTWSRVGDDINQPRQNVIFDDGVQVEGLWYHLKLFKADMRDKNIYAHALMMRQVYSLAAANIDPTSFSMWIERLDPTADDPSLDESGVPYLQVFGLDAGDDYGQGERDGEPDLFSGQMFDLRRGLLLFPDSFVEPFDGSQAQYEANAAGTAFVWEDGMYLPEHLAPGLYDVQSNAIDLMALGYFRMVMEHTNPPDE